jgi:hypothetical protein
LYHAGDTTKNTSSTLTTFNHREIKLQQEKKKMYDEIVKQNFDTEYLKEHNGSGRFIEKSIILEITNLYKGMVAL